MADGKTVTIKDVPQKDKVRAFSDRGVITVDIPEEVRSLIDDAPCSIDITPMTHKQVNILKRKQIALDTAEKNSIRQACVKLTEYTALQIDSVKLNSEISEFQEDAQKMVDDALKRGSEITATETKKIKKINDDISKLGESFEDKWNDLLIKLSNRDFEAVYEKEDDLLETKVMVVSDNCKFLNFERNGNEEKVAIDSSNIENIHRNLFFWIYSKIEENSTLSDSEIMGLH